MTEVRNLLGPEVTQSRIKEGNQLRTNSASRRQLAGRALCSSCGKVTGGSVQGAECHLAKL